MVCHFKDFEEAVKILTSKGKFHISLGLERVQSLLELFENPQDSLNVVHVAGTNGKGSTCAMLSSVLTCAGYKTGLYTSPHLVEYSERIKINGENISKQDFSDLLIGIISKAEENNIFATEFELLTVACFVWFKRENVDIAIIETGLGGRLDATNIVKKPLISIITTIDIDHTDRLGNTIEQIAFEKSGIIKDNVPIITLNDNNGIDIIKEVSRSNASPLILTQYDINQNQYKLSLSGIWQVKNLSLVLKAIDLLNNSKFKITETAIKQGLETTVWPCRFQYIKDKKTLLDGAHNFSGAKLLRESLDKYFPDKKFIWIYGSINTKDFKSIIKELFRPEDTIICSDFNSKSAVNPELIIKEIDNQNIYITNTVKEAFEKANLLLNKDSLIVCAGSLYMLGEVLEILNQ